MEELSRLMIKISVDGIEIVDSKEKINGFLPIMDKMVNEGLITLEKINVVMYRANKEIN